jgi:type IV secretion system protein VirD4
MKPELKKLLILNAPYLLFVYLFDKIGQAVRFSPGADLSGKVLSLADGFSAAFTNPLPSLARMDLLIGIVGAVPGARRTACPTLSKRYTKSR